MVEAQRNSGPASSDCQLKRVACRILAGRHVEPADGTAQVLMSRGQSSLGRPKKNLYKYRGDTTFQSKLNGELNGSAEEPASMTPELVSLVENKLLEGRKNKHKFHQFILDGEASNLCERANNFDFVILSDRKHELISLVVTEVVQKIFPAETVDMMGTATRAFACRFPSRNLLISTAWRANT